ncbi:hypothetical protein [Marivita sp.]|uniref:hypothetical protein n=1 Tax=Marivita sp. TaxID=2003365 RepID=UPI003F715EF3
MGKIVTADMGDEQDPENRDLPEETKKFLSLFESAVHRANDREWNRKQNAFTFEEVLANVTDVLEKQLFDRRALNSPMALILKGSLALQELFEPLPPNEETIKAAIEYGLDDPVVFDALRTLAALGYASMSPTLKKFQTQFLAGMIEVPKSKRGPSAFRDIHRNTIIVGQIEQLKAIGIAPTRSSATNDVRSGCDIVALALEKNGQAMSYFAIEKIWKKREEVARPDFLAEILTKSLTSVRPENTSD